MGGVVGNFPDSLKRSNLRPRESTTVTPLCHPQSQLTPEHPQKLAQESVSKTNTNLRNTSWRKGSLQLSIPWKTHQQVSLKKTGEHSSPVGLRVWYLVGVCVFGRCSDQRGRGKRKIVLRLLPQDPMMSYLKATCSLSCLASTLRGSGQTAQGTEDEAQPLK